MQNTLLLNIGKKAIFKPVYGRFIKTLRGGKVGHSMRIFKTQWFSRFARKEAITDGSLLALVSEMEEGRFNADLGGGVYKERLGRIHGGKSGGFRLLVCFRHGDKAFFTYGFPKSERANINAHEEEDLKKLSDILLALTDDELTRKVEAGAFEEITGRSGHGSNL